QEGTGWHRAVLPGALERKPSRLTPVRHQSSRLLWDWRVPRLRPSRGCTMERKGTTHMKRLAMTLVGSTFALLLAGAGAHAAPLFNYNWSPDTQKPFADGFGPGDTDHYVNFSNEPPKDASVNSITHKTHLVATNLTVFSTADDDTPDNINSNYGLTLVL